MTPAMRTDSLILEIPYRIDSTHYVERILDLPHCIFFDSGFPDSENGRYDIFSAEPLYTLNYSQGVMIRSGSKPECLTGTELTVRLNELLKEQYAANKLDENLNVELPFYGGFAGYFSYDLARCWETLPEVAQKDIDIPELLLGFYLWAGVIDHHNQKAWISFLPTCSLTQQKQIYSLLTGQEYGRKNNYKFNLINELKSFSNVKSYNFAVAKIQKYIMNGDCYQVNYAQRFNANYEGHPWAAYKKLRTSISAAFGCYFQFKSGILGEDTAILSYSPERFVKVSNKSVLTQPIKGTIKREKDPVQDRLNIEALAHSEKDHAENLMIVDLLRNDLGKCCDYGSVKAENLFEIQSTTNVHHLVSSISGKLRSDLSSFDLLQAMLPGGSVTGTPKIRSIQIIEELEPYRRSIYCGAIGYININGDMDSNIAIRTVLCDQGHVYCWGGGGIIADSVWEKEYEESLVKITHILDNLRSMSVKTK